ncbi:MAG: hypothetical protein ACTSO7_12095 [Candidatus Heimdallarchaeota archaeon]
MFKELMSYETEQEKLENRNEIQEKVTSKVNPKVPKFLTILCPKSSNPLSTNECSKCSHKEEYHRSHKIGSTLSTMICTYTSKPEQ